MIFCVVALHNSIIRMIIELNARQNKIFWRPVVGLGGPKSKNLCQIRAPGLSEPPDSKYPQKENGDPSPNLGFCQNFEYFPKVFIF